MSIFQGAAALRGVRKSAGSTLTLRPAAGWHGDGETPDAANLDVAMKLSAVNRSIELISDHLAVMPATVLNLRTMERAEDHYLSPLLTLRANEAMTAYDSEKLMQVRKLATGNAYAWYVRDGNGFIREKIPLPPGACWPQADPVTGQVWYVARDQKTGQFWKISPADICHYKAFSTNGLEGISVLRRAEIAISTGLYAQQYEQSTFKNGGRPGGLLYTDQDMGDADEVNIGTDDAPVMISKKEFIRREWDRIYSGPGNAFRTAVLDVGLKYQPIAISNHDNQFVESRQLSVEDIARFFGVPPHKLGIGKQTYENNEQANTEYAVDILLPGMRQLMQEDSWKMLTPGEVRQGWRVWRDMEELLMGDSKTRAEVHRIYRECGVYNADDICRVLMRKPVPGGDVYQYSLNYAPQDMIRELSLARNLPKGE